MGNYIVYNGTVLPANECPLTPQNRAFRYGDGVFETIRCFTGQALWLDFHHDRLKDSAHLLKINIPETLTLDKLTALTNELLHKNGHTRGARLRLSFFRAEGGHYQPDDNTGWFLMETSPLEDDLYLMNKKGLNAGVYTDLHKKADFLSGLKTSSALLYVMASLYASEMGWDETFILNESGHIAEAASSNIFMDVNGVLYTPALDQGCVNGVMRRVIMNIAAKYKIKVVECAILPDDLLKADEVFICNAVKGVQWVKGIEHKRYYHEAASRIMKLLQNMVTEQYP